MVQQIIALIIILFFLSRILWQRKKGEISSSEYFFWIVFWFIAGLAIISLKWIDSFVADLGFSGSGIEVLLYLGVAMSFYFIFRLRLRQARLEKDITKVVREIAINKK